MTPKKIRDTLKAIQKKYGTTELLYDGSSINFVVSVCSYFVKNGKISDKQRKALEGVAIAIHKNGPKDKPIPKQEPDKPGFLGINCRTGKVNWHSWQIFESY